MALEVGIVGPPGSGKTSLFTALTKAGGGEYGKTNVGMAPIADGRLGQLAAVVKARKVTPATIRVQDIPGSSQFGALRQVDAVLVVAGIRGRRHARRRSRDVSAGAARGGSRSRREASRASREAGEVRRPDACAPRSKTCRGSWRARRRRRSVVGLSRGAAGRARASDDEAADRDRERAGRDRSAARGRARGAPRGGSGRVPRQHRVRARRRRGPPRRRPRPDYVLHRGGAGAPAPGRFAVGRPRSMRRRRSIPTSRAGSSAARWSTGRISSSSARTPKSPAPASRASRERRTSSGTATS